MLETAIRVHVEVRDVARMAASYRYDYHAETWVVARRRLYALGCSYRDESYERKQ